MKDIDMKMLILKAGSTFASIRRRYGDFDAWILAYAGLNSETTRVVDAAKIGDLPMDGDFSGVIITGSHTMVTDRQKWIDHLSRWISEVARSNIPILGICFGHQLMARAMGGEVGYHPAGCEIGTVPVSLTPTGGSDSLLGSMPKMFPAHATHAQTVIRLPKKAHCLASNPFEPHHAFRIGRCAWGVQFHPEFSAEVMHAYIEEQADDLRKSGYSISALKAGVAETASANVILKRFTAYCHLNTRQS